MAGYLIQEHLKKYIQETKNNSLAIFDFYNMVTADTLKAMDNICHIFPYVMLMHCVILSNHHYPPDSQYEMPLLHSIRGGERSRGDTLATETSCLILISFVCYLWLGWAIHSFSTSELKVKHYDFLTQTNPSSHRFCQCPSVNE